MHIILKRDHLSNATFENNLLLKNYLDILFGQGQLSVLQCLN